MSRFDQSDLFTHVGELSRRMIQADTQLKQFVSTCGDIYQRWQLYLGTEDDPSEEEASRVKFAIKTSSFVDDNIEGLATALDIIAGGMRDENGDPLTRQDLLDKLAAVIGPQE